MAEKLLEPRVTGFTRKYKITCKVQASRHQCKVNFYTVRRNPVHNLQRNSWDTAYQKHMQTESIDITPISYCLVHNTSCQYHNIDNVAALQTIQIHARNYLGNKDSAKAENSKTKIIS